MADYDPLEFRKNSDMIDYENHSDAGPFECEQYDKPIILYLIAGLYLVVVSIGLIKLFEMF
jgi:hypothetical protein